VLPPTTRHRRTLCRLPAAASLAAALKEAGSDRIHGKVKLTVFDYLAATPQAEGTADVFLFPDGLALRAVPLDQLNLTVVEALAAATARRASGESPPAEAAAAADGTHVAGTCLIVCCHAARDERCGCVGPALVAELGRLAEARGLLGGSRGVGGIQVLRSSHVGGHVVRRRRRRCSTGQPGTALPPRSHRPCVRSS
jgi:hypothetical protein